MSNQSDQASSAQSHSASSTNAPSDGRGLDDPRFDERGLPQGHEIDTEWEIGPRDVHRRVFRTGEGRIVREGDTIPLLIDCRTDQESSIARIPGSLHVPMHEVNARLEELRVHEERSVIVYCHTGRRSLQVAATLRQLGFDDVRSMHGGIDLWSQSVDPEIPRY